MSNFYPFTSEVCRPIVLHHMYLQGICLHVRHLPCPYMCFTSLTLLCDTATFLKGSILMKIKLSKFESLSQLSQPKVYSFKRLKKWVQKFPNLWTVKCLLALAISSSRARWLVRKISLEWRTWTQWHTFCLKFETDTKIVIFWSTT